MDAKKFSERLKKKLQCINHMSSSCFSFWF